MSLLQLEEIEKRFGEHHVLRGVTVSVSPGEIVCLLGPSGSGKTTLLRTVAGLERVDGGRIWLAGELMDAPRAPVRPPERRRLGMVFQDFALWPHLSAIENVALPLRARGARDARGQALKMLERVGLAAFRARKPHELSGGQQQRVALARALAVRPRLLLCDEPLSSLDATLREELRVLIGSVVREHGLAALYITHDQREAFALADRVGVIECGRLLQIDAPRTLWQHPASEAVARFTHAFGPWKACVDGERLQAPWGACTLPPALASAPRGPERLYLRAQALRPCSGPAAWTARARVGACVFAAGGVELLCDLHGVALRVAAEEPVPVGAEVALAIAPAQALIYPGIPGPAHYLPSEEETSTEVMLT